MSLAIDHLRDSFTGSNVTLAYFYFSYKDIDSLSAEVVLRSLLRQLLMFFGGIPQQILELRQKTESQERPLQREDLEQVLQIACGNFDCTFLVIGR